MLRAILYFYTAAATIICCAAVDRQRIFQLLTHLEGQYQGGAPASPPPPATRPAGTPSNIGILPRGVPCSLFLEENMQEANNIIKYFLGKPNFEDFMGTCTGIRNITNEELYLYALQTVLVLRNDTCDIQMPRVPEIMPQWFIPKRIIDEALQRVRSAPNQTTRIVVDYDFEVIAGGQDPENRMAYFREDLPVNSHHWSWHLIYPNNQLPAPGTLRDRQGELFYWMHQQVIARYSTDRICVGLPKVIPFEVFTMPIPEEYAPTLLSSLSGNFYPSRPRNLVLQDVPDRDITVNLLQLWFQRIFTAIQEGAVMSSNGTRITLTIQTGIDILGAIVEATLRSINQGFYGNGHNRVHTAIARITTALQTAGAQGVMGFSSVAMRDTVFYRWHAFINNLFNTYKVKLPRYTPSELGLSRIIVTDIFTTVGTIRDVIRTFWQRRQILISRGVDFTTTNPVFVNARHLQHESFVHNIYIDNQSGAAKKVTVRIYLAPFHDEQGNYIPFEQQRRLFIHLDTFTTTLKVGPQMIRRKSEDSSVTIPNPGSFDELGRPVNSSLDNATRASCGCGWPDSMLLPIGRIGNGMEFDYFVMVTDGADYTERSACCTTAPSYCGILNQLYPDRRSMGFPFDRQPNVDDVHKWAELYHNILVTHIRIVHDDRLV